MGLWGNVAVDSLVRTVAVGLSAGALAMATAFGTTAPAQGVAPNGGGLHAQSCNDSTNGTVVGSTDLGGTGLGHAPKACPGPAPDEHP